MGGLNVAKNRNLKRLVEHQNVIKSREPFMPLYHFFKLLLYHIFFQVLLTHVSAVSWSAFAELRQAGESVGEGNSFALAEQNSVNRLLNYASVPVDVVAGQYQVRIKWGENLAGGSGWIEFLVDAGHDIFSQQYDPFIPITILNTTSTSVFQQGDSAFFCHACVDGGTQTFGGTCWGITPITDTNRQCGCSGVNWAGEGIYYGGLPSATSCTGSSGGFAGPKLDGEQKGGLPSLGFSIELNLRLLELPTVERFVSYTCRNFVEDLSWLTPATCSSNVKLEYTVNEYSQGYGVTTAGTGVCEPSETNLDIVEVDSTCPHTSVKEFTRPLRISIGMRVPCQSWDSFPKWALEHEGIMVFGRYGIRLARGTANREIEVTMNGVDWTSSPVFLANYLHADIEYGSNFHEIVFDLDETSTHIYYNTRQVAYLDFDDDQPSSGQIKLRGTSEASAPVIYDILVQDNNCTQTCSNDFDCSGNGVTYEDWLYDAEVGCPCNCTTEYRGSRCSETTFLQIDGSFTCEQDPPLDGSGTFMGIENPFLQCHILCDETANCNYFALNMITRVCDMFIECLPMASENTELYQRRAMCGFNQNLNSGEPEMLGSMHMKLLTVSKFLDDSVILYFAMPEGYTMVELDFNVAKPETDDSCHYPPVYDGEDYWTVYQYGCIVYYQAILPVKQLYDPLGNPRRDSIGFTIESNQMSSKLTFLVTEPVYLMSTQHTRSITTEMPWTLILQTRLTLEIDLKPTTGCSSGTVMCGQCQTCPLLNDTCIINPGLEGQPCPNGDGDAATYPDICINGICVGTPLCPLDAGCPFCQKCDPYQTCTLDDGTTEQCATCVIDFQKEGVTCDDGEVLTLNDQCELGECVGTPGGCDCDCDLIPSILCGDDLTQGCNCDQTGCDGIACCNAGYCDQTNNTYPGCNGGSCNQNDTETCQCEGGLCHQWGCTDPECREDVGCYGNCNFPELTPCPCQYCELGYCIGERPNGVPCGDGYGQCIDGTCVFPQCQSPLVMNGNYSINRTFFDGEEIDVSGVMCDYNFTRDANIHLQLDSDNCPAQLTAVDIDGDLGCANPGHEQWQSVVFDDTGSYNGILLKIRGYFIGEPDGFSGGLTLDSTYVDAGISISRALVSETSNTLITSGSCADIMCAWHDTAEGCEDFASSMEKLFVTKEDPQSPSECYLDVNSETYVFNDVTNNIGASDLKQRLCICQACPNGGAIPESQRSYSSKSADTHSLIDVEGGWELGSDASPGAEEWVMFDLSSVMSVHGVVTQGNSEAYTWVTSYIIQRSLDSTNWDNVTSVENPDGIFMGNTDFFSDVVHTFPPVSARYIRIIPLMADGAIGLRANILMNCPGVSVYEVQNRWHVYTVATQGSGSVSCPRHSDVDDFLKGNFDCWADTTTADTWENATEFKLEKEILFDWVYENPIEVRLLGQHAGNFIAVTSMDIELLNSDRFECSRGYPLAVDNNYPWMHFGWNTYLDAEDTYANRQACWAAAKANVEFAEGIWFRHTDGLCRATYDLNTYLNPWLEQFGTSVNTVWVCKSVLTEPDVIMRCDCTPPATTCAAIEGVCTVPVDAFPSSAPITMPSRSPHETCFGYCEEHDYLEDLSPELKVLDNYRKLGFPLQWTQYDNMNRADREFSNLLYLPPQQNSRIGVYFNGNRFGSGHRQVQRNQEQAVQIRMMIQTRNVYPDNRQFRIFYQLVAADGTTRIDRNGLSVKYFVGDAQYTASTSRVNHGTGVPHGASTMWTPNSWFQAVPTTRDVYMRLCYWNENCVNSQTEQVHLGKTIPWDYMTEAGMMMFFAQSPRYSGNTIAIDVYGHSGGRPLGMWWPKILYNTDYILFETVTTGSLWEAVTTLLTRDQANDVGILELYSSGPASGISLSQINGVHLHLVSYTFSVHHPSGFTDAEIHDIIQVHAVTMTDVTSIDFATNKQGYVVDKYGMNYEGTLEVLTRKDLSAYVTLVESHLFHTNGLGGGNNIWDLNTFRTQIDNQERLWNNDCISTSDKVSTLSGLCRIQFQPSDTMGESIEFTVMDATYTVSTWEPVNFAISVENPTLQRIDRTAYYQRSRVRLFADWNHNNEYVYSVIINELVSFASGDPIVLSVSGDYVEGESAGNTTVSAAGVSASVTVLNDLITITELVGAVVTHVTLGVTPTAYFSSLDKNYQVNFYAEFAQTLTQEGAQGQLMVYALLEDGTVRDISGETDLVLYFPPSSLRGWRSGSRWLVAVVNEARGIDCRFMTVDWRGGLQNSFATDVPAMPCVNIDLPEATHATISSNCNWMICRVGDAANAVFNILYTCQLRVYLHFPGGISKDMTFDDRTEWDVMEGMHIGSVTHNGLVSALLTFDSVGDIVVEAKWPTYWAADHLLNTRATVQVVMFTHITLEVYPYPAYEPWFTEPQRLSFIHCSLVYQRAITKVFGHLSTGASKEITNRNDVALDAYDDDVVLANKPMVQGLGNGFSDVWATFWEPPFLSDPVNFTVDSEAADIIELVEHTFWDDRYNDYIETRELLKVDVIVDDGTRYNEALHIGWVQMFQNLHFWSDYPSVIPVDEFGYVTLKDNLWREVFVNISEFCPTEVVPDETTTHVWLKPNLEPLTWDADLDMIGTDGLQLDPRYDGNIFHIKIRFGSQHVLDRGLQGGALVTWSLKVWYDKTVYWINSCWKSGTWADKGFDYNIDTIPGEILFAGIGGNQAGKISTSLAKLEVARCEIRIFDLGNPKILSLWHGYVSELKVVYEGDSDVSTVNDYYFVAGKGWQHLNEDFLIVRYHVQAEDQPYELPFVPTFRRNLQMDTCGRYVFEGDANCSCPWRTPCDSSNDCIATPYDAEVITYYMATATKPGLFPITTLSFYQRTQLDPVYDWLFQDVDCIVGAYDNPCPSGGSDVTYALRYLVKKYHWVSLPETYAKFDENWNAIISSSFHAFFEKDFFTWADTINTQIFYEIKTYVNQQMFHNVVIGEALERQQEYLKFATVFDGNRSWILNMTGPWNVEYITITIMMETINFYGDVTYERKYGHRRSVFYGETHIPFLALWLKNVTICDMRPWQCDCLPGQYLVSDGCENFVCPEHEILYGNVSYTSGFPGGVLSPYGVREENSQMEFDCLDGFELFWNETTCRNGSWDHPLPDHCEDIDACVHFNCTYNNETVFANCSDIFGGLDSIFGRICECPPGYEYDEMSGCVDIDACEDYPCVANALCEDLPAPAENSPDGRVCTCESGYNVTSNGTCEDVDDCDPFPCGNGTICENNPFGQGHTCECRFGYTVYVVEYIQDDGQIDFENVTFSYKFYNLTDGSISSNESNSTNATDKIDFEEIPDDANAVNVTYDNVTVTYYIEHNEIFHCRDVNVCLMTEFACGNNSICVDLDGGPIGVSGRVCICPEGTELDEHDNCVNIESCEPDPCIGEGTVCTDLLPPDDGFNCTCEAGYAPMHNVTTNSSNGIAGCEEINECEGVTCQNGGTPTDLVGFCHCECLNLYEGEFCENRRCDPTGLVFVVNGSEDHSMAYLIEFYEQASNLTFLNNTESILETFYITETLQSTGQVGLLPQFFCCPEGHCDQRHCYDPCCQGGHCDQTATYSCDCGGDGNCIQIDGVDCICVGPDCAQQNGTNPACPGGGCNQTNTTNPTCTGCGCDQTDAINPYCSPDCPECPGNCAFMGDLPCKICENGNYIPDPNLNNFTCTGNDPTSNCHCWNGDCHCPPTKCTGVNCGACRRCEADDNLGAGCVLDDSAGGCEFNGYEYPECYACENGACAATPANGNACDDHNLTTINDRCHEGNCTGQECVHECDPGDVDCHFQFQLAAPCCDAGYCNQNQTTNSSCDGGHCDQQNATECICNGGFCDQTGCCTPSCEPGNCIGNCDTMSCDECHECVCGRCEDTLEGEECGLELGYIDAICVNGTCHGTTPDCAPEVIDCSYCEKCISGGCFPDHEMDGSPCMDTLGSTDAVCEDGECLGSGPGFTMIDDIVINAGLQENDLNDLQADISLDGIVAIQWPWKLIDVPDMNITSPFPVEEGTSSFEVTNDCPFDAIEPQMCTQQWSVFFRVDKICDTLSVYYLGFKGLNQLSGLIVNVPYQITLAQQAICGVVLDEAPLNGELYIYNPGWETKRANNIFGMGATVFLRMDLDGLAPIKNATTLDLSLILGENSDTFTLIGPLADPVWTVGTRIWQNYSNDEAVIRYTMVLNSTLIGPFLGFDMSTMIVSHMVQVVYYGSDEMPSDNRRRLQRHYLFPKFKLRKQRIIDRFGEDVARRFLQDEEELAEPGFEYNQEFMMLPFECQYVHPEDGRSETAYAGNYLEVPCLDDPTTSLFLYCDESGWNPALSRGECAEHAQYYPDTVQQSKSENLSMWIIIAAFLVIMTCGLLFLKIRCVVKKRKDARDGAGVLLGQPAKQVGQCAQLDHRVVGGAAAPKLYE